MEGDGAEGGVTCGDGASGGGEGGDGVGVGGEGGEGEAEVEVEVEVEGTGALSAFISSPSSINRAMTAPTCTPEVSFGT